MLPWVFLYSLALFALTCGSAGEERSGFNAQDGGLYVDDAVVLNAAVGARPSRQTNDTRSGRQFPLLLQKQQDEGAFGQDCVTTLGKEGTCKTFHECYPLIKVAELQGLDGWVLGHYDTCSYISAENTEVFGVCCTEPVSTPPQNEPDIQRLGFISPALSLHLPAANLLGYPDQVLAGAVAPNWLLGDDVRQIPAQWPPALPPLPTHPPDHAAPTHPPSFVAGVITSSTQQPPTNPTMSWVTKPTKPTVSWMTTTKLTTKKPLWPMMDPTQTPAAAADSSCGVKNGPPGYAYQDEERIVGGHNADLNEWPWIAVLFNGGRQFCGGSLIDDKHVLSAAHCVAHMTSWDVARLTVRLGEYNIRTNSETQHVERKVKRVVRHRGFDMRTLYNDVSLLTLDQPVKFTKNIRPVCLPGGGRAYEGSYGTVIGWGSLSESGPQPSILQEVSIPIWTNSDCRLKYGAAAPGGIVDHMLCAGRASMDSCSGDSGGPLMVNEGGRWTQVGVVSWGIGCGKGQYPGVYTRVTHFLPWIKKNISR